MQHAGQHDVVRIDRRARDLAGAVYLTHAGADYSAAGRRAATVAGQRRIAARFLRRRARTLDQFANVFLVRGTLCLPGTQILGPHESSGWRCSPRAWDGALSAPPAPPPPRLSAAAISIAS